MMDQCVELRTQQSSKSDLIALHDQENRQRPTVYPLTYMLGVHYALFYTFNYVSNKHPRLISFYLTALLIRALSLIMKRKKKNLNPQRPYFSTGLKFRTLILQIIYSVIQ